MRNAYSFLVRKHEGSHHMNDIGMDGMVILKWIVMKYGEWIWAVLI
jgi:hypothetical protein